MKIGIAGPISLNLLNHNFGGQHLPDTFSFPLISHIVNGILKKGHQVVVYTLSNEINEPLILGDEQLRVCIGRHEPHPGRDFFKSERKDLVQLMKKYPADIINAHWSYEYGWAALDSGIPHVITVRDHATTILRYHFIPYRIVRWIMNYIVLNRAGYLTTNSNYLWGMLTKSQQKKAVVISNFYAKGLEEHFKTSSVKGNYIISVNNGFSKRKNVENGLKAYALLRKRHPDLQYYVVGGDMEENGLANKFAIKYGLTEGVVFLGYKSFTEVIEMIKHAKIMLHTSREESFGNAVLESMVVGTPVVGGDRSGNIPFLLNHGKAGILCDINSPDGIMAALELILNDEKLASQIREDAFSFATSKFSESVIINQYLSVYEGVLSKNRVANSI